jgi:hypothetical protein
MGECVGNVVAGAQDAVAGVQVAGAVAGTRCRRSASHTVHKERKHNGYKAGHASAPTGEKRITCILDCMCT